MAGMCCMESVQVIHLNLLPIRNYSALSLYHQPHTSTLSFQWLSHESQGNLYWKKVRVWTSFWKREVGGGEEGRTHETTLLHFLLSPKAISLFHNTPKYSFQFVWVLFHLLGDHSSINSFFFVEICFIFSPPLTFSWKLNNEFIGFSSRSDDRKNYFCVVYREIEADSAFCPKYPKGDWIILFWWVQLFILLDYVIVMRGTGKQEGFSPSSFEKMGILPSLSE